jgi:putative drug exporter of the RND superfamily
MFATALGAGILIDATIIRGVLTPAAVALAGRWNWWVPSWAARLLRVAPWEVTREAQGKPASPLV